MAGSGGGKDVEAAFEALAARWRALEEPDRGALLEGGFPVLFSYNSGKIENDEITLHDTREVFDRGRVVSFTGDPRTIFEIANLKAAWGKMIELSRARTAISVDELLDVHRTLTQGTYDEARWSKGERPGAFKRGDYVVAGDVGYGPSEVPGAVESLLAELAEWNGRLKGIPPRKALTVACYAHAALVDIHPFADGNGRTARSLMNILLMRAKCPPVCVDERDRMAYYGALDAFHAEGDLGHFVSFCMVESLKTWGSRIERALAPAPHVIAGSAKRAASNSKSAPGDSRMAKKLQS